MLTTTSTRRRVCLLLLLTGCGVSSAQSVREQVAKRELEIYAVIFGITVDETSALVNFRVLKVIDPTTGKDDAVAIDIPPAYTEAVRKKVEGKKYQPRFKDGKPIEFSTYFFFTPKQPTVVVVDLDSPLSRQP